MKSVSSCPWAAKHQISWVIAPWWIFITFIWPNGSLLLPAPSSRSERHLHFASLDTWSVQSLVVAMFVVLQPNGQTNNWLSTLTENHPFYFTVFEILVNLIFEKNKALAFFKLLQKSELFLISETKYYSQKINYI